MDSHPASNPQTMEGDDDFIESSNVRRNLIFEEDKSVFVDVAEEEKIVGALRQIPEEKIPKIGMEFETEEEAHRFYKAYARLIGFGTRLGTKHMAGTRVVYRIFNCACEGKRGVDKRDVFVKRPRPETRTNCSARMIVNARYTDKYKIIEFVEEHKGHGMVSPRKVHMLRGHRHITTLQATQVNDIEKCGIRPKAGLDYMAQLAGGREYVGYTLADVRNYLRSKRTIEMKEGDAGGVLNYLQLKQSKDPNFVSAIQLDEDELITNIFWADGQMRADYLHFGDVVSFDTTHKKNSDGRPFAMFIGVNHHKQTIIFGAALLYDETADTFNWLFDAFVDVMGGKKPETILTDQDAAMGSVLSQEKWNGTAHRLCIWHIYQNASLHLSSVFNKFPSFCEDFTSCVYDYDDEDDFIDAWQKMLEKYTLQDNVWLQTLFEKKEKWALVYGKEKFCAQMTSTQRSESMHSVLKKYVNYKHNLLQFFHHFDRLVDDRRYEEMKADLRTIHSTPHLALSVRILKHARIVYTHEIFKLFQAELGKAIDVVLELISESGTISEYKITPYKKKFNHFVTYDASDSKVTCSCKKYEFAGILCAHALKVYTIRNVFEIPELYIKKRWKKKAKSVVTETSSQAHETLNVSDKGHGEEIEKARIGERSRELARLYMKYLTRAAMTDETFDYVKSSVAKMSEEIEIKLENISLNSQKISSTRSQKSSVEEKQIGEENLVEIPNDEEMVNEDVKSASQARGFKVKPDSKVKSGKRFKSALEKAVSKRKPKQSKTSSSKPPNVKATTVDGGQAMNPITSNSNASIASLQQMTCLSMPPLSQLYQNQQLSSNNWSHSQTSMPQQTSTNNWNYSHMSMPFSARPLIHPYGHVPELTHLTGPYVHQRFNYGHKPVQDQHNMGMMNLLQEQIPHQKEFEIFTMSKSRPESEQPSVFKGFDNAPK